eukprot:TRINITY_DN5361_c0_g1_i1.p1 TRINITY_DN5361_c0_g1~~TRINITY_DN5361_c0_g1_i1.p1  ORF type:complete len:163 (-),score=25.59 TRINITY_DN5361_c0_g1_i1:194-682(-)
MSDASHHSPASSHENSSQDEEEDEEGGLPSSPTPGAELDPSSGQWVPREAQSPARPARSSATRHDAALVRLKTVEHEVEVANEMWRNAVGLMDAPDLAADELVQTLLRHLATSNNALVKARTQQKHREELFKSMLLWRGTVRERAAQREFEQLEREYFGPSK